MRLSEAFLELDGGNPSGVPLELVVKVYNINPGKGDALLGKCEVLGHYSALIALVREAEEKGLEEPLTWAVKEGIRRGILPGYLERKSAEVVNMLTMEYNYADDVAAQREESFEAGRNEGRNEGRDEGRAETIRLMMGNMNLTFAQVMDALKIEPSERDKLASLL